MAATNAVSYFMKPSAMPRAALLPRVSPHHRHYFACITEISEKKVDWLVVRVLRQIIFSWPRSV